MARDWTVRVHLDDTAGAVIATATLVSDDEETLSASGQFRSANGNRLDRGAQYELATAHALQRLSDALITAANRSV